MPVTQSVLNAREVGLDDCGHHWETDNTFLPVTHTEGEIKPPGRVVCLSGDDTKNMLRRRIQPGTVLAALETHSVLENNSFELLERGVEDCIRRTIGRCKRHQSLFVVAFGKRTEDVKDCDMVQSPSEMSESKSSQHADCAYWKINTCDRLCFSSAILSSSVSARAKTFWYLDSANASEALSRIGPFPALI